MCSEFTAYKHPRLRGSDLPHCLFSYVFTSGYFSILVLIYPTCSVVLPHPIFQSSKAWVLWFWCCGFWYCVLVMLKKTACVHMRFACNFKLIIPRLWLFCSASSDALIQVASSQKTSSTLFGIFRRCNTSCETSGLGSLWPAFWPFSW